MGGEVSITRSKPGILECPHEDRPSVLSLPSIGDPHICAECYGPRTQFIAEPFGGVHGYCGPVPGDLCDGGTFLLATEHKANIR